MARSDSSRLQFYSMPEATRGTVASTALQAERITGLRMKAKKQTVTSGELRRDRQVSDITQVGAGADLGVDFEFSYGTFDEWIAGLLFNAWSTPVSVAGSSNISFVAATKKITKSGASFDTQFKVGEIIRVKGTTSNGTNGTPKYFTITALSATDITVSETVVDESNTSAALYGCRIRNWEPSASDGGFVDKAYTCELKASDLSNIFASQRGMTIGAMDLSIVSRAIVTGQFTFLGMEWTPGSATVGTGAATAATTTSVVNATSNVASLMEGGSALATAVKGLRLNFNNNLREQAAVANQFNIGIGGGQFVVTGSIDPYFEDNALLTKFKSHTESSLRVDLQDAAGNRIICSIPALYYGGQDAGPEARGNNSDTQTQLPIAAKLHSTLGYTVQFCRFPAS